MSLPITQFHTYLERKKTKMTLKTWKKEFYPKAPTKKMTTREAIEHSIKKWEGLRPENLEKHGMRISSHRIEDELDDLDINADSCALCKKFYFDFECVECPLYQQLGKRCDANSRSPYQIWRDKDNPVPMIKALKRTLEECEE